MFLGSSFLVGHMVTLCDLIGSVKLLIAASELQMHVPSLPDKFQRNSIAIPIAWGTCTPVGLM